MKKTLGVLSLAAAAWLGSTAYIGNNVEEQSQKLLSSMQEKYKSMGMDLKIEIKDKSFFTSKAVMTLDYPNKAMKDIIGAIYNLPMQVDYEIEHGPIFFKNGLGVGLVRTHSQKEITSFLNEDLAKDLNLSKDDLVLKSSSIIDFSNNMTSNMTISGLHYNDNYDMGVETSPMVGSFDFDLDTMEGTGNLQIPLVKVYNPKQPEKDYVIVKDTTFDMTIDKFISDNIYLGDVSVKNKEIVLAFSALSKEELVFSSDIKIKLNEDKDKNIKVAYEIDAEHLKGKIPEDMFPINIDPKKVSLKVLIEGLSAEGLEAFQKYTMEIQKKTQMLVDQMYSDNKESSTKAYAEFGAFQAEMQSKMVELGQGIFADKKAKISFDLSVKDENKKDNHVNASFAYIGDKLTGSLDEIMEQLALKAFESVKAKVDVSIEKSLIDSIQSTMDDREKQDINMGLMMGKGQGIIVEKDNAYKVNAEYGPNKLILNNKDMSNMIDMLKMGM